jgi:FlaA1/EpsC-like NDP-sugar epimerase
MPTIKKQLLKYRLFLIATMQALLVILSYLLAFEFRFDFEAPHAYLGLMLTTLPLLIACRLASFYYYGLFNGWWSYVGMEDVVNITKAVFFSSLAFITCLVFIFEVEGLPRSVLLMDAILLFLFLTGSRVLVRMQHEHSHIAHNSSKENNILIAGAGNSGVVILNEIRRDTKTKLHPVGFVDDNPYKRRATIQGLPVLGTCAEIPDIVAKHDIDQVLICMPSATWKDLRKIHDICKRAGVTARSLPGLSTRINSRALFNRLKDVSDNELLGRNTISFRREEDIDLLRKDITGHNVLITGAGGSIGSELSRQTARLQPKNLILYERNENGLYHLELDLRKEFPEQSIVPIMGDILDEKKFDAVLNDYTPNLIYHAAAYKHVPMMERSPLDAVQNNILGTYQVAKLAIKHHVRKFILISTDKAVNPANIMGATKRVSELLLRGLAGNGTGLISVRFGNVIGSNGSVVPLLKHQIAEGGPITITHPEVSRYFMAISEAVQLVMVAGALGEGGEIFLLDMGEPIKVLDLAIDLIKRCGLEPGKDIDTVFTGLRPGEKMHEELYWQGEGIIPTPNKKITMIKGNGKDTNAVLGGSIISLQKCVETLDVQEAIAVLKRLVPEATIVNHLKRKQFIVDRKNEQTRHLTLERKEIIDTKKLLHSTH